MFWVTLAQVAPTIPSSWITGSAGPVFGEIAHLGQPVHTAAARPPARDLPMPWMQVNPIQICLF